MQSKEMGVNAAEVQRARQEAFDKEMANKRLLMEIQGIK